MYWGSGSIGHSSDPQVADVLSTAGEVSDFSEGFEIVVGGCAGR
jgi:hypothetical protein